MAPPLEDTIHATNVYVFLSDALRWDALPDTVASLGAVFKTTAASCATMRAVPSILSGLCPPRHGVSNWSDTLQEPTIFDLDGFSTGFYNHAAGSDGALNVVLDQDSKDTLETIEPPFVYFERDQGGHAPYRDLSYDEMLSELDHTPPSIQKYYREMVTKSTARFEERLQQLADRELLEDTLVVFLSDHGEHLGERGFVSHSSPPTPELVTVPTVFVHPDIDAGERDATIGHVDLAPTILAALDTRFMGAQTDGCNLFEETPGPRYNDARHDISIRGTSRTVYLARGLWEGGTGHVFTETGKLLSPAIGLKKAQGWNRTFWATNPEKIPHAIWCMSSPHRSYGNPDFSADHARERVNEVANSTGSAGEAVLGEDVEAQLKNLGYRS